MTSGNRPKISPRRISGREGGYSGWFVLIVFLFVTSLLTANVIAVKVVDICGLILPAGVLVFPLSYIVGDVLTEVYGYSQARRVIWLGFFCNSIAVTAIYIGGILPPAPFWKGQAGYEQILGYTPRLLLASFLAYLAGEFANAVVLARLKVATNGRWLWSRTIGSTIVGQGLDSLLFVSIAFAGAIPAAGLVAAIIAQWLVKSLYEALLTPLTYLVVNYLKREEGVDFYDRGTRFHPFAFKEDESLSLGKL